MKEWQEEIIEETIVDNAQSLIDKEGFSIERALSALGVPEEKRNYYAEKLREPVNVMV